MEFVTNSNVLAIDNLSPMRVNESFSRDIKLFKKDNTGEVEDF